MESQDRCLGWIQAAGVAHGKPRDGSDTASEVQEKGTSAAEEQKLQREILSQLLSRVQSNAASLIEPLFDTGMAHTTAYCCVSLCRPYLQPIACWLTHMRFSLCHSSLEG